MKKENTVRLLVVESSSDQTEMTANLLRRAGHGAQVTRVEKLEDIRAELAQQTFDLIISLPGPAKLDVQQVLTLVHEEGLDIPLIVVTRGGEDQEAGLEALRNGARDLVQQDQPERLQLAMLRELADLKLRRNHRVCEASLREAEKRNCQLLDSSRDAIAYVHDGMHIYANAVYLSLFGYVSAKELKGVPVMDMVAAADHARLKDFLRNYSKHGPSGELELLGRHSGGMEFKLKMEFSAIKVEGETCTQITIRDLSQNQELQEKIKQLSRQDLLTGLYNHRYFMEELERAVAQAKNGETGTMLYIGIDSLPNIKESLGISASNMALGDIARLIHGKLGNAGLAARLSDEVFAILLPKVDIARAQKLAETLRKAVEATVFEADAQPVSLACTVCACALSDDITSSRELLLGISRACVTYQNAGDNRVHVYNPVAEARVIREKIRHWTVQLQAAIDSNRFRLLYQPIISLRGGTDENYQVLLRLLDEQGNEMRPEQFMPDAEQVGLMGAIDRWVIERAVKLLAARRQAGHKTSFFIKLFVDTMADKALLPWISQTIEAAGLPGAGLVFEVRETSAANNLREAKEFVNGLQQLQCRFATNHSPSGNGGASFGYLKHLPVNYIKLNGALMQGLLVKPDNQATVRMVNEAAHGAKILTVAECVEDAATLALLWQYGVDYVQGYYFQQPSETLTYDFAADQN
ncbi:MAG: EAL domain-containing protein [Gammaproteobacteria bacterium]|nr:EAL domain-containing protein [Gammaproteobacteria bacterium]